MNPEWVLFALLAIFWIVYALRPLLRPEPGLGSDERRRLVEAKRGYLYALRDAEIDFESGKLSEPDYAAIRARLEEKTAEVLRLLDDLGGGSPEVRVARALDALRGESRERHTPTPGSEARDPTAPDSAAGGRS